MKPATDMHEGPEAFTRFENLARALFSIPREAVQVAVTEHREKAKKNPKKRGPKAKR